MVVNSLSFLIFFIVVFTVYYMPGIRQYSVRQNIWLLITGYFFYGFIDWKMLPILLGVTVSFYWIGKQVKNSIDVGNKKKASYFQNAGVVIGISILLYFKYLNFFAESVTNLLNLLGLYVSWTTLNIALPVGVSFFTFKLISYVIEIKRKKIQPAESLLEFATYISFFPTILSGPIDKPNTFIPQLKDTRLFNYDLAVDGCRQILWGMFTKMCIADNLATVTDSVWASYIEQSGSTLAVTALLYLIQLYADFDGYSNMAIGVGKLLGLNITRNFKHPLLARNIAEFWRNWHISLTGWLTEYVFTPLNISFRNMGITGVVFAIILNFVLIGLWHGAKSTYAFFGLYNGMLFIPLVYSGAFGKNKKLKSGKYGLPKIIDFIKMICTFVLVSLGLIIFRAETVSDAIEYISLLCSSSLLNKPEIQMSTVVYFFCLCLLVFEWLARDEQYTFAYFVAKCKLRVLRFFVYWTLFFFIFLFQGDKADFIYFQF